MKIALKSWLSEVWSVIKNNWFKLSVAAFIRNLFVTIAGNLAFAAVLDLVYWNIAISLMVKLLVWSAFESGFIKMCLSASRKEEVSYSQLFAGISMTPVFFAAVLIYSLCTTIGIIALVVPGIFICVRYCIAFILLTDKRVGLIDSFKSSRKLTLGFSRLLAPLFLTYATLSFTHTALSVLGDLFFTVALTTLYLKMLEAPNKQNPEVQ